MRQRGPAFLRPMVRQRMRATSARNIAVLAGWCLLAIGLLPACGPQPGASAPAAPPRLTVQTAATPAASAPGSAPSLARPTFSAGHAGPSPSPADADALIARAIADAADQAGVSKDDVRVVDVGQREWPDRSLGCPRPGMGYAQAITPGLSIVVEAGGRTYRYHTDRVELVRCDR